MSTNIFPNVTVVIPAYNSGATIERAVFSVINQDYQGQIEIVVVDDGSNDNTQQTLSELDLSNCKLYCQPNLGASAARYHGVQKATSNIVLFLDSDDWMLPNHISTHLYALQKHKEAMFSFGLCVNLVEIHEKYPTVSRLIKENVGSSSVQLPDALFYLLQDGCFPLSMNIACYKYNALVAMKGREHVKAANDYDFCLRLAIQGDGVLTPEKTIEIERFNHGITATNKGLQPAFACLNAYEAVRLSKRNDKKIRNALKHRIEISWPAGFTHCAWNGYYLMALKTLIIGLRKASTKIALRNIRWTIDYLKSQEKPL